jgi:hypothetical protein
MPSSQTKLKKAKILLTAIYAFNTSDIKTAKAKSHLLHPAH